ncbi:MAG: hypothetical protein D6723_01365 [Acidobacteria bacterium]|nr:MAG: hypothetical protein D6723_01365 [Acidobacteriota bacterium]
MIKRARRCATGWVVLLLILSVGWSQGDGERSHHRAAAIPNSAHEICPLLVGERVPSVTLKTVDGRPFDLSAAIARKPTVLIFYRGGW